MLLQLKVLLVLIPGIYAYRSRPIPRAVQWLIKKFQVNRKKEIIILYIIEQ